MSKNNDFDDLTEKLLHVKDRDDLVPPCATYHDMKKPFDDDDGDDEESFDSGVVWLAKSEPSPASTLKNKKKKSFSLSSCLCKCVLITTLVLALLTVLVSAVAYFWVKDVVEHLTIEGNHRSFPVVRMSDVDRDLLQDRVKIFVDELRRGPQSSMPLDDLVITQDEINGFLCHSDFLRGNLQVTLQENNIVEEYSLPMDMFPGGKGRYFDGHDYTKIDSSKNRMELKMETAALHKDWFVGPLYLLQLSYTTDDSNTYHQQLLQLFLENGSIFGNAIPDDYIREHQNLLEGAYSDPESGFDVRTVVEGIEDVQIQDGKIVIMPRRHHYYDEDTPPAVSILDYEPALYETKQEPEPIVVEFIAREESFEEEAESMDYEPEPIVDGFFALEENSEDEEAESMDYMFELVSTDKDSEDEEEENVDNIAGTAVGSTDLDENEATFLRANKVQAAAPNAPVAWVTTTSTSTSNIRGGDSGYKSNP